MSWTAVQCSAESVRGWTLLDRVHTTLATDQLVLWLMVAIYPSMVAMMVAIYPSSLRHPGQAIMDPAPGARGEQPCLATSQSVSLTICLNHKMASNMASWITVPAHVSSLASRDPTVFVGTQYHVEFLVTKKLLQTGMSGQNYGNMGDYLP